MNEKAVLLEILTIISYEDNKVNFVEQFFALILSEAIAETMTSLPPENKKKLEAELKEDMTLEEARSVMHKYISQEKFDARIQELTTAQLTDYLDTIYPTLSEETSQKLTDFLTTLPRPPLERASREIS